MKTHSNHHHALRRVIGWDIAMTAPAALAMAAAAGPLAAVTHLPEALLRGVGIALLPYVAWLAWLASRPVPSRTAAWAMVGLNAVYAVECLALPALGWVAPGPLGLAFLGVQALVVGGFAVLGMRVLRQGAAGPQPA